MPVKDIGRELIDAPHDATQGREIAQAELARYGDPLITKRQARRELSQHGFGSRAACRAVEDQADVMSARRLALHQVDDVAKQATERRSQHVNDLQTRRA